MSKVKIRLHTAFAGPGIRWRRGDVVTVDSKQAKRLCDLGKAELVRASPKKEKAIK